MNHINRKPNNKISMGCDYYIEQNLYIHYNDNDSKCIRLRRDRGYYSDIYDDFIMNVKYQNSNMTEWEKIKEYHLEPRAQPYLVYTNNSFTNMYVLDRYQDMVKYEIVNYNKNWDDIKEIVILEERYERD
jgi:hypothetical protein